MSHDDYMEGFNRRIQNPENYDQQRGIWDREHNDAVRRQLETSHTQIPTTTWSNYGSGDSAAGGGLGGLVLAFFGVWLIWRLLPFVPYLVFPAFVLATTVAIAGVVVLAITRLLARDAKVGYALARQSSLAGLWRYIVLTVLMRIAVGWFQAGTAPAGDIERVSAGLWHLAITSARTFSAANDVSMFASSPVDQWPSLVGSLLLIRGPGILAFAHVLSRRIVGGPYRGFSGFLLGTVVALFTVEVSVALAAWGCLAAWSHAQIVPFEGDERLSILVVYSAVLLLPCAVIGGLFGGAMLKSITRLLARKPVGSYGRSYSTAVRSVLAYGFLTVLAVFLFRDADAVVLWLAQLVFGKGPHDPTFSPSALTEPFAVLLVFQLPGLLAAGAEVARREFPAYNGALGYAKACVVAGITCLAICVPFWAAALRALPEIVAWVNAQPVR